MFNLTELSALRELAQEDRILKHAAYMRAIGESTVTGVPLDPEFKESYDASVLLVTRVVDEYQRIERDRLAAAVA